MPERRPSMPEARRPFALTQSIFPVFSRIQWGIPVLIITRGRLPIPQNLSRLACMSTRVIIPGEEEGDQQAGGVHKRPPIPDNSLKAECPKFMSHGPCGGVRKGGLCEVYPEMACPWVTLYIQLEKIGQVEWMKQV
jgi:hypothetical protein